MHPMVSIIMPIRNEAVFIRGTLDSILQQEYPSNRLEMIVADGMSTDGTREIIKEIIRNNPEFNIQLVDNPRHIFSTGFNRGLAVSCGEFVVMLGGHAEIAPDYIQRCVSYLEEYPHIDCVGGTMETVALTKASSAIALAMSSPFGVGGVAFRTKPNRLMEVDTVAFAAYRRSVFHRCGPLDEEMIRNQDDEFNYRLGEMGSRILLAPDISIRYYSRASINALWHQYFQYGYWKVRVMQKHPGQMRPRHFVPFAFVASLLGSTLLTVIFPWGWITLMLVVGLYTIGNIIFSILTVRKQAFKNLALMPLIFATLHLSYGLGFLAGLLKFWNRWGDRAILVPALENTYREADDPSI